MSEKISHSQISTYTDCQKKWELEYVKGLKITNVHLIFGSMAHKVLETRIIPEETLYPELKESFNIKSWFNYFTSIFEELDKFLVDYEVLDKELAVENDELRGIIDLVLKDKKTNKLLLMDYKFSNSVREQEDLLLDEQLYIYAVLGAQHYDVPIEDISIGFISIPKTELDKPRLLKNGTLSKDKHQNTTYDKYVAAIKELNQNVEDYADILEQLTGKSLLNIHINHSINKEMLLRVALNIDYVIRDMKKGYVIEKCSYLCKNCGHLQYCKYGKRID